MDIRKPLCIDKISLGDCGRTEDQDLVVRLATSDKESVGLIVATIGPVGDPDSEAYARLFAAAPALLAVCQKVLVDIGYYDDGLVTKIEHTTVDQIRNAIKDAGFPARLEAGTGAATHLQKAR